MIELIAGFSAGRGFAPLSWMIRKVLGTSYSHTYVRNESSYRVYTVWEAVIGGIRKIPFIKWKKSNKVIKEFRIMISYERWATIKKFIEKHAKNKTKYGKMQLVWNLFDRFGISLPFNNKDKRMICSEFIAYVFAPELGLDPEKDNLDLIDPLEIYEMFENIESKEMIRTM